MLRAETRDQVLRYHGSLARRRFWQLQLWRCSLGALLASTAAWLLHVPTAWHVAAVTLGFAAGFAWPVRNAMAWALGWIDRQSGYSYRTALEHADSRDEYGFAAALQERVRAQLKRVEQPVLQPWWLPVLTLALGLTLMPLLEQGLAPDAPASAADMAVPQAQPQQPAASPDITTGATQADGEPRDDTGNEGAPSRSGPDLGQVDQTFGGSDSTPSDATAPEDSQALSRFLQNLQSRPADPDRQDEPPDQGASGQGSPQSGQRGQPGRAGGQDGQRGGQDAGGQPRGGEGQGQQPGQNQGNGEGGQEPGPAGGQQPGAQPGNGEAASEQGRPGQAAQGQDQNAGGGAPSRGENGQGRPDDALEGGAGEGAGTQPPTPGSEGEKSGRIGSSNNPQGLEGRFLGGPTSAGGQVLLPGLDDKPLPGGRAPADFERALEQAVNEGRIPVEYQQILRDYYK